MTKPTYTEHGHTILFDEDKHVYVKNGEYIVGMSTLLGKLASPALEAWKVNSQVNAIKKEMEIQGIPLDKIDKIIINAKANAKAKNDNILSIGSIVHKLIEKWLKGEKVTKPEDKIVANCFAIFSKKDNRNELTEDIYEKLINLNFKFIFDYSNFKIGPELSDYLETGEIIIRPDKKIFGLSSKGLNINELVSELLMQIE